MCSYGKVWALEHRAVSGILEGDVVIQEKIDGSQLSFGVTPDGYLRIRSKSANIDPDCPDNMFALGVEYIKSIQDQLVPGFTYFGEYLRQPKHNTLAYDRIPRNHIILFDVLLHSGSEIYSSPSDLGTVAALLGLEAVPVLPDTNLDVMSILGGQKIEGVVIKNYDKFGIDGKVLRGKKVREEFKEFNGANWKKEHPSVSDIKAKLAATFTTPARWHKSIQHLRDDGRLTGSPRDIGPLIKEIQNDVSAECMDAIKHQLFQWVWPDLSRALVKGFAPWYLALLNQDASPIIEEENATTEEISPAAAPTYSSSEA